MQNENGAAPAFSESVTDLLVDHFRHLNEGSGISVDVIKERGYRSIQRKGELEKLGFSSSQQRAPGILIPLWGVEGTEAGYQFRPDNPRSDARSRPVKYELPFGAGNRIRRPVVGGRLRDALDISKSKLFGDNRPPTVRPELDAHSL